MATTMHVRKLAADGDDSFGHGMQDFRFGSDATKQRLGCDLKVILGEWFWDESDGVPWTKREGSDVEPILGRMPANAPYTTAVLTARCLACNGVASITSFDLYFDTSTRQVTITVTGKDVDGGTFTQTVTN